MQISLGTLPQFFSRPCALKSDLHDRLWLLLTAPCALAHTSPSGKNGSLLVTDMQTEKRTADGEKHIATCLSFGA